MSSKFLPLINLIEIKSAYDKGEKDSVYDMLVQPLHEELYKQQTFAFVDSLSWGQQLLITYDYLYMQAMQGGFIQFLHNGYVGLLPTMIEQLYLLKADTMAKILDDVLKVYVLNRELLENAQSVEAFAKLYDELKEFEGLDEQYKQVQNETTGLLVDYAIAHLSEFSTTAESQS